MRLVERPVTLSVTQADTLNCEAHAKWSMVVVVVILVSNVDSIDRQLHPIKQTEDPA